MNIVKKGIFKLFPFWIKSKDYADYLRKKGICIGKGTYFFGPATTEIDIQRPWMLSIGEYCKITGGVKILCHDYSRSVLRRVYGEIIGEAAETKIGNNVFIGVNSIILMGSHIGDNVIIGAGSVVSGTIQDNVVVAGNPARVIRTLDEHYKIRKRKTIQEAKLWVHNFYKMYNRKPTASDMGPFWQLFMERDEQCLRNKKIFTALNGDDEKELIDAFMCSEPIFEGLDDFLKICCNLFDE